MSGILNAIEISSQGLSVQRQKMNTVAENMANAETTETPEGGPYRRKRVIVFEDKQSTSFDNVLRTANNRLARTHPNHRRGITLRPPDNSRPPSVEAERSETPKDSYRLVYDPGHPDADEEGYVKMPDVDIIEEMVDMMAASRGYEANTVAISAAKKMARDALDI
jgi:flagellar basal-body rod protein FlgC